jgi:hypothetical protein
VLRGGVVPPGGFLMSDTWPLTGGLRVRAA